MGRGSEDGAVSGLADGLAAAAGTPGRARGGRWRLGRGLLLPVALLVLWQAWGMAAGNVRTPLPTHVVTAALALIASGDLLAGIAQSLQRVFLGFAAAAAIAVPLGLAMGYSRAIERNMDPLVESFRPIAAIAILPLAILWLGTGTGAAVLIVAYAAFFPIVINTIAGAKRVDPTLLRAAATMGLSRLATLRTVVVPAALPAIGVGLRIGMGVAWTAIVAAELAVGAKAGGGGSGGIGQMMFIFYAYSIELNRIVVCMIGVGVVAFVLDRLLRVGMKLLMPWTR
jgi:ABC-type nitrate/sulfonate/bicarbonate transport system permease component